MTWDSGVFIVILCLAGGYLGLCLWGMTRDR